MASWETYKGNILVPDEPTGDAGINLKDDLTTLRDGLRLEYISKTAGYTALANDLVLCNSNSSSFTITLPNNPLVDTRVGVKLQSTAGGNTVTVRALAAGGGHIIGTGDEGNSLVLYVAGDYVEFSYTGSNFWQVVSDTRQPHVAELVRNSSQTISNDTETQFDFDSVPFDNAGLASTSTDKITIRRAGAYVVSGNVAFANISDDRDIELRLKRADGAHLRRSTMRWPVPVSLDDPCWQVDGIFNLSADEEITLHVIQVGSSGSKDTNNSIFGRPRLTVAEVR